MQYDSNVLSIRNSVANFQVKQDTNINTLFLQTIMCYLNDGNILLDIGTGNGFVLSQILKYRDMRIELFGVDNSSEMVGLATQILGHNAKIVEASCSSMPFSEAAFDIVTAKNVTRIDVSEIFRVLKDEGVFIYREYGYGKGMIEIAEMFSGRVIRQREPYYYIELLLSAGFQIVKFDQYEIAREYSSAQELVSIVKSFPFIENFSDSDESLILEKFAKNATITSDPFILVAQKSKGSAPK